MHNSEYPAWLNNEVPCIANVLVQLSQDSMKQDKVRLYVDDSKKWFTIVSFESLNSYYHEEQEELCKDECSHLSLIRNFDSYPKSEPNWSVNLAMQLLCDMEIN
ncbi:hypothetical protein [Moritella sp. F3]|uniref:hypothetical protein n=1 Tax=Moritella sp. F3 TaxID=2718882 RepID=UPI0018E15F66|nr:hypothetical protein [Moritella sp. F3]GIC77161.1 hypothetical protein FMO001_18880 [Moritella sp. F1]GIC82280.1 hypothetical protein FMO003_25610 [Moritella sp. F3]